MKHLINGCPIYLRGLSEQELDNLINSTADRLARVREELDSLGGEKARRCTNVHQLQFDLPPHHSYDGDPAA